MPFAFQCILIDDEPSALTALALELEHIETPRVTVLATFTKSQDALNFLSSPSGKAVQVIFLDVEMPEMDGLAFLESFADRDFEVILTTAHSKYAIDAIRKKVFDYLVKPITRSALESALNRLVYHRSPEEIYPELIPKPTSPLTEIETRIRLDVDRKVLFIEPADIIYCESDGNYCRVYLERDKSIFLTRKLKAVGLLLPPQQFLRVHKSYIVNLKKIKEYHRVENYLVLNTDKYIPVSQKLRGYFT